jgi:hypothetical protein
MDVCDNKGGVWRKRHFLLPKKNIFAKIAKIQLQFYVKNADNCNGKYWFIIVTSSGAAA